MKTYAIRDARTKTTGHLRQDGTRTTYCNKPVGIPNGDFQGLKGWRMCTICTKGEQRDRAEATVTATAALTPETTGTLPAMVCIQHGADCTGDPKRSHIFHPAPTAAPHPVETYYTLDCNNHGATCDANPKQRHDYRHSVLTAKERAQITAGTVPPGATPPPTTARPPRSSPARRPSSSQRPRPPTARGAASGSAPATPIPPCSHSPQPIRAPSSPDHHQPGRIPRPGPDHRQEQPDMDTNVKRPFLTSTGQKLRDAAMDAAVEAAARVIDGFERSRAAARSSVASSTLADLAQDYDEADTDRQRAKLAAHIASAIPLAEAGTIRRAAEAIKLATPGIILRASGAGLTPNEIARELGATGSYVRRILRENREFSWRLDLLDSKAGPGWQPWEHGTDVMPYSEDHNVMDELAAQIIEQGGRGPREHAACVTIWHGPEGQTDETAIYSTEFHQRTT